MKRMLLCAGLAAILTLGMATSARAIRHFANCTATHHARPHGVARSRGAANAEVADGYGRPYVSRPLYMANSSLDANHDGVACEA
jgi:hypothetical protein